MSITMRGLEAYSDALRELEEQGIHPLALVWLAQQGPTAMPQIRFLSETKTRRAALEAQVERLTAS